MPVARGWATGGLVSPSMTFNLTQEQAETKLNAKPHPDSLYGMTKLFLFADDATVFSACMKIGLQLVMSLT